MPIETDPIFNAREIAIGFWSAVLFVGYLIWSSMRDTSFGILKALLAWPLVKLYLIIAIYMSIAVYSMNESGLWSIDRMKSTLMWFFLSALPSSFNIPKIQEKDGYIRKQIWQAFQLSAIITFVIEWQSMVLWAEVIIVPVFAVLGFLIAFGQRQEGAAPAVKLFEWVLAIAAITYIWVSLSMTWEKLDQIDGLGKVLEFLYPIFLFVIFAPCLLAIATYFTYSRIFAQISGIVTDPITARYAKKRALTNFNYNVGALEKWARHIGFERPQTKPDIDRSITRLKAQFTWLQRDTRSDKSLGWAPSDAEKFLEKIDFRTNDYHQSPDGDWWASSKSHKTSEDAFMNTLQYLIYGGSHYVSRLKLKYFCFDDQFEERDLEKLYALAEVLIMQAYLAKGAEGRRLNTSLGEGEIYEDELVRIRFEKNVFPEKASAKCEYLVLIEDPNLLPKD